MCIYIRLNCFFFVYGKYNELSRVKDEKIKCVTLMKQQDMQLKLIIVLFRCELQILRKTGNEWLAFAEFWLLSKQNVKVQTWILKGMLYRRGRCKIPRVLAKQLQCFLCTSKELLFRKWINNLRQYFKFCVSNRSVL